MAIDTIGANALSSNAVTQVKLADNSVGTSEIIDANITTAKVANDAITSAKALNLGRRNLLINGDFSVWQRGVSFTTNVYGADRWKFYAPGSHAYARSTDTPDTPINFKYSASCTGSGDSTGLTQFIESINASQLPISGSTKVILSFYLKHTTNSGSAKITSDVGTMNAADVSGATTSRSTQNHNTTTSWARYTHEMTGAELTAAAVNGLKVTIKHNGAGATLFLLTGIQLEIAEAVTDFEHRLFSEELSSSQRYFTMSWKYGLYTATGTDNGIITSACVGNINRSFGNVYWPTEMRAAPTVTWYSGATGTVNKWRNNSQSSDIVAASATAAIGTKGYGFVMSAGIVAVTDSLHGHYTAECEL